MNSWHPDSPGEAFLGVERRYWYKATSSLSADADGCIRTQGWHTLDLVAQGVTPSDYAGLAPYEWCVPPSTISILAHGSASPL
jgi:hypothetical protein